MTLGAPHDDQESALLVAVPEAEDVVQGWRRRYDPSARAGIPAHITLIYPFLAPDRLGGGVVDELRRLFAPVRPIRFRLDRIGRFPGVLYLRPVPAEPFERLTAAVATLFPEAPPYRGVHSEIVPHLTVAHSEDEDLLRRIESALGPRLPVEAVAEEIWLMEEQGDDRWHLRAHFPLEGSEAEAAEALP